MSKIQDTRWCIQWSHRFYTSNDDINTLCKCINGWEEDYYNKYYLQQRLSKNKKKIKIHKQMIETLVSKYIKQHYQKYLNIYLEKMIVDKLYVPLYIYRKRLFLTTPQSSSDTDNEFEFTKNTIQ